MGLGFTGVKFWVLPLKWLVTFTTVLHYCAACDGSAGQLHVLNVIGCIVNRSVSLVCLCLNFRICI